MTREEFIELVYLTLNDRPTNCDANAIIEAHDEIVHRFETILFAFKTALVSLNNAAPLPWSIVDKSIVDHKGRELFDYRTAASLIAALNLMYCAIQISEVLEDD